MKKSIIVFIAVLFLIIGIVAIPQIRETIILNIPDMFMQAKAEQEQEVNKLAIAATVSADKKTVMPGETFDVSVTLTEGSIGWAVLFEKQNEGVISNEEIIETIAENKTGGSGYIYMVQITGTPKIYEDGTIIATKRYTVSETAIIGSSVTINVTGDISGANQEFNSVDGSVTIKVGETEETELIGTISYDIETLTNQDVTASITFNKENVTVTNNDGNIEYTFSENGTFTFEFRDEDGNVGSETAAVEWIDKEAIIGTVVYEIPTLTNQDVTASITFNKENVTVTNNDGNIDYTFSENGTFTFEFEDAAGNTGTALASVDWIDKEEVIGTISYDVKTLTNQNVTASITFNKENVEVTNNQGKTNYVFSRNGTFTFEFRDGAGNTGTAIASVDWIQNSEILLQIEPPYELKDNKYIVNIVLESITADELIGKLTTNATEVVIENEGQVVGKDDKIKTGMELVLRKDGKEVRYVLIVRGDINGDGEINGIDALKVLYHRAYESSTKEEDKQYILEGTAFMAANLNKDGNIIDGRVALKILYYRAGLITADKI